MRTKKDKAKQSKQQPASAGLIKLQHEVAALRNKLAALEARFSKGGAITCSGLNVVNANNEPVATISGRGQLACNTLRVGQAKKTEWMLSFNSLVGALEIWDRAETIVASINPSGVGGVRLCMPDKFHTKALIRLELKPGGGAVNLHDGRGKSVVQVYAGAVGGTVHVESSDPQKGFATLEIDASRSGQVVIVDSEGNLSARLP